MRHLVGVLHEIGRFGCVSFPLPNLNPFNDPSETMLLACPASPLLPVKDMNCSNNSLNVHQFNVRFTEENATIIVSENKLNVHFVAANRLVIGLC